MKRKITMKQNTSLTLDEAFDLFIKKATVKNLSPATIKTYGWHYNAFCRYKDKGSPLTEVNSQCIDGFILFMRSNSQANDITINSHLRTMRSFLYYCMDCDYLPRFKMVIPKAEKKIKETYTDTELERLLKKPDKRKCTFTEYKTWVFENYLLGTGNRLSSALSIRIGDIDFQGGTILIRKTKNRKQQIVPLSNKLSEILTEYLSVRGGNSDSYLFCNECGDQGNYHSYQQAVRNYNINRNVNKTSCHLFRHTFAKNWILNGGDIFRLQKILGHSNLDVVREYVNMFSNDLSVDFERYNPLDRLSGNADRIKINPHKSP